MRMAMIELVEHRLECEEHGTSSKKEEEYLYELIATETTGHGRI